MSIDHVLNFLCYNIRPHLENCLENVQHSLSNLQSSIFSLLQNFWRFKAGPASPSLCQPNQTDVPPSEKLEIDLHQRSREIWQSFNTGADTKDWVEQSEFSKLPFHWMAVGGDALSEDPFENFKFFIGSRTQQSVDVERCLWLWYSLSKDQRMPFRFEACLARIASGKINFRNEREIRDYMSDLCCSK